MVNNTGYCTGSLQKVKLSEQESLVPAFVSLYNKNQGLEDLIDEIYSIQQQAGSNALDILGHLMSSDVISYRGQFILAKYSLDHGRQALIYFDTSLDQSYSKKCLQHPIFAVVVDASDESLTLITASHDFSWDLSYYDTLTLNVPFMLDNHHKQFLELWYYICGYTYGMSGIDLRAACPTGIFWFTDVFGEVVDSELDDGAMDSSGEFGSDETYAIEA